MVPVLFSIIILLFTPLAYSGGGIDDYFSVDYSPQELSWIKKNCIKYESKFSDDPAECIVNDFSELGKYKGREIFSALYGDPKSPYNIEGEESQNPRRSHVLVIFESLKKKRLVRPVYFFVEDWVRLPKLIIQKDLKYFLFECGNGQQLFQVSIFKENGEWKTIDGDIGATH